MVLGILPSALALISPYLWPRAFPDASICDHAKFAFPLHCPLSLETSGWRRGHFCCCMVATDRAAQGARLARLTPSSRPRWHLVRLRAVAKCAGSSSRVRGRPGPCRCCPDAQRHRRELSRDFVASCRGLFGRALHLSSGRNLRHRRAGITTPRPAAGSVRCDGERRLHVRPRSSSRGEDLRPLSIR